MACAALGGWVGQAGEQCSGPRTAAALWGTGSRMPAPCRMGNRGTQHPAVCQGGGQGVSGQPAQAPPDPSTPTQGRALLARAGPPCTPGRGWVPSPLPLAFPWFQGTRHLLSAAGGQRWRGWDGHDGPAEAKNHRWVTGDKRSSLAQGSAPKSMGFHPMVSPAHCPQGGVPVPPPVGRALEGSQQGQTPQTDSLNPVPVRRSSQHPSPPVPPMRPPDAPVMGATYELGTLMLSCRSQDRHRNSTLEDCLGKGEKGWVSWETWVSTQFIPQHPSKVPTRWLVTEEWQ